MKTVIVGGAIANKHLNGGESWVRLNWVLGLKRLGFRVVFVEQIARGACVDAAGAAAPFEDSANLAYFKRVMSQFGLAGSAALIYEGGEQSDGLSFSEVLDAAADAALLVNISGHLGLEPLLRATARKVYVDIDPGFTQFWHADESLSFRVGGHDYYYTIGENIGTPDCSIPTGDIEWRKTRPPVVLDEWPACGQCALTSFTTVANWRGPFGRVEFGGRTYGLKLHEFRKFVELPSRTRQPFEVALNIHPADAADLKLLRENGWGVVAPEEFVGDPLAFRGYVQASGAEFSVAQGIYVDTKSGWFSDRTACYLASGKPALVQDTGFSHNYRTGVGLVPFRTLDEAAVGARSIAGDYEAHCLVARELAEELFDSDKVLSRLVDEVGV